MAYSSRQPPVTTGNVTTEDGHTVLNATRARQGRYGRHVFWVLVASTLLAGLGLLIAWAWKAPELAAASDNGPPKSGPAFHASPPPTPTVQK